MSLPDPKVIDDLKRMPIYIYEGEQFVLEATYDNSTPVFGGEYILRVAKFTEGDKYDDGWSYIGTVNNGRHSMTAAIIEHYLTRTGY